MKQILILLLAFGLVFPYLCSYNVTSLNVGITVEELQGTEYFELETGTIDFNGYMTLYNDTKIFFHKYYPHSPCSEDCNNFYPQNVRVGFIIMDYATPSGINDYTFSDIDYSNSALVTKRGLTKGDTSKNYPVEGKTVRIFINDITAEGNCFPDVYTKYCDDSTLTGECSTTKPYICTLKGLEYDQVKCGCPIYGCIGSICSDGTFPSECSEKIPEYCDNGKLVDNPIICGCPEYSEFNPLGKNCLYTACSDGTKTGECSETKPYYCEGGELEVELIERSSVCGCPNGEYIAINDTCLLMPEEGPGPVIPEGGFENETEEQPEETPAEPEEEPKQEELPVYYYIILLIILMAIAAYIFLRVKRN